MLLPFVILIAVFYFLLIRPENKKKKAAAKMRSELAVGDEIITRHGGTFEIGNADGGGALVTITLPIPPHTEHR